MKRTKIIALLFALTAAAAMLMCGCGKTADDTSESTPADGGAETDYLVLVNYENPLPKDWLDRVKFSASINSVGDDVFVEAEAYKAYLGLKEEVENELKDRDVTLQLDSAYRSEAAQQKIVDDFTEKYGEEYVKNYVAVPGYSEHHTGLALDLYFIVGDKTVYENEDLVQYTDIWDVIHEKLPKYGFILRYPEGKDEITKVSYEPWHLRYVGSPEIAEEITEKGVTFEEYIAEKNK